MITSADSKFCVKSEPYNTQCRFDRDAKSALATVKNVQCDQQQLQARTSGEDCEKPDTHEVRCTTTGTRT